MSKLKDGFKNDQKITAKWRHYDNHGRPTVEWKTIPKDEYGTNASEIGGSAGYLTIKAVDKNSGGEIESSLTLHPFSFNGHKVKLLYDKDNFEWKIMAEAIKFGDFKGNVISVLIGLIKKIFQSKQTDVNVEIGPKNP